MIIFIFQTCGTCMSFYNQPITACIIHNCHILSWCTDIHRAKVLSVQVVLQNHLHVGVNSWVGLKGVNWIKIINWTLSLFYRTKLSWWESSDKIFDFFYEFLFRSVKIEPWRLFIAILDSSMICVFINSGCSESIWVGHLLI